LPADQAGEVLGAQTNASGEVVAPVRITNQILDLNLTAGSALAIDGVSGKILYEKNKDLVRPIASISKLMSALVFLDQQPHWQNKIHLDYFQDSNGQEFKFTAVENLTAEQIFNIALAGSINQAVNLFPRLSGLDKNYFLSAMNQKAAELGLAKTYFADLTGLSAKNVSTAAEVALLLQKALAQEKIYQALHLPIYEFQTELQTYRIKNTNELLTNKSFQVLAGKTGSTDEAGFCLVTLGEIRGRKIITVVLGAESEANRFQDTKALYWWAETNFNF